MRLTYTITVRLEVEARSEQHARDLIAVSMEDIGAEDWSIDAITAHAYEDDYVGVADADYWLEDWG